MKRFERRQLMINTNLVKERMSKLSLTQEEVAKRIEISRPIFNLKLNNKRPMKLEEVKRLSEVLELDGDQLQSYFFV